MRLPWVKRYTAEITGWYVPVPTMGTVFCRYGYGVGKIVPAVYLCRNPNPDIHI